MLLDAILVIVLEFVLAWASRIAVGKDCVPEGGQGKWLSTAVGGLTLEQLSTWTRVG
jgi:hypothetical protein